VSSESQTLARSRWRPARRTPALRHHCWNDRCVIFDPGSGDTLLLTVTAWQVLSSVYSDTSGISFPQLAIELQCGEPDAEMANLLQQTLAHFETLGLIEKLTG
jgi:PqqD family protein of HPr-rel-A system